MNQWPPSQQITAPCPRTARARLATGRKPPPTASAASTPSSPVTVGSCDPHTSVFIPSSQDPFICKETHHYYRKYTKFTEQIKSYYPEVPRPFDGSFNLAFGCFSLFVVAALHTTDRQLMPGPTISERPWSPATTDEAPLPSSPSLLRQRPKDPRISKHLPSLRKFLKIISFAGHLWRVQASVLSEKVATQSIYTSQALLDPTLPDLTLPA